MGNPVKVWHLRAFQRLTRCFPGLHFAAAAIVVSFYVPCALCQSGTPVTWSPPALSRWFFPGQTYQKAVKFTTSTSLTGVSVFVVPELQPYVTVQPAFFPNIVRNTSQTILLTITVPGDSALGRLHSGTVHLRATSRTLPQTFKVTFEVQPGGFEPIDPSTVVQDSDGSIFPVTQLLARLGDNSNFTNALTDAQEIDGSVTGGLPFINLYQLRVPARSAAELRSFAQAVSHLPGVVSAHPEYLGEFASTNDLMHLDSCFPGAGLTAAYDKVALQQAYDLMSTLPSAQLRSVRVGLVDSGIDISHWEFQGVLVITDAIFTSNDKALGHGTAVSGIIGANDLGPQLLTCDQTDATRSAFQMNGVLSGVPGLPHYSLRVLGGPQVLTIGPSHPALQAAQDTMQLIAELGAEGIPIVNLSFGIPRCGALSFPIACISDSDFQHVTNEYQQLFQQYQSTLFVVSAGNHGINVIDETPANANTTNTLAVGATGVPGDREDQRYIDGSLSSNFGTGVDLAAPGKTYAPAVPTSIGTTILPGVNVPGYAFLTLTSASAPMVTGATGILQSLGAGSPANLKFYLSASGDPIVTDKPIGGRRLNVFCGVQLVLPPSQILSDDFSEGYRDCSRWFTTVQPPGIGLMAVANQQLEMVKASSGNGYMGLASRCKVAGDFDVQVDYRLSIWPAQNFHTVRLIASDLPDGGTGFPGVYRNSYADENYQFRNQLGLAGLKSVSTSDTSGTIGLKRTGQTLSGYDSHGTIGSAPTASNPTGFTIDFATPSNTAPGDVAIAFDNFKVNAGTVSCPQ